jgi:hypothetical protein
MIANSGLARFMPQAPSEVPPVRKRTAATLAANKTCRPEEEDFTGGFLSIEVRLLRSPRFYPRDLRGVKGEGLTFLDLDLHIFDFGGFGDANRDVQLRPPLLLGETTVEEVEYGG